MGTDVGTGKATVIGTGMEMLQRMGRRIGKETGTGTITVAGIGTGIEKGIGTEIARKTGMRSGLVIVMEMTIGTGRRGRTRMGRS